MMVPIGSLQLRAWPCPVWHMRGEARRRAPPPPAQDTEAQRIHSPHRVRAGSRRSAASCLR